MSAQDPEPGDIFEVKLDLTRIDDRGPIKHIPAGYRLKVIKELPARPPHYYWDCNVLDFNEAPVDIVCQKIGWSLRTTKRYGFVRGAAPVVQPTASLQSQAQHYLKAIEKDNADILTMTPEQKLRKRLNDNLRSVFG